jgi:hypothetical protein
MIKFPYITNYSLFEKIDIAAAEELLGEYNDFVGFNKTQIRNAVKSICTFTEDEQTPETDDQAWKRAEHNTQVAIDHFEKLFKHKDIVESVFVGMKIDYDAIQKVLLDETARKVPIIESTLNNIGPVFRALASVLLFAEHVVSGLRNLMPEGVVDEKCELAIEFAKEGFELLLDGVSKGNLAIPSYTSAKPQLNKIKKLEQYIEFCEKLFFENR